MLHKTQSKSPSWNDLYDIASIQYGLFTTAQAREAGYSVPLLAKYLKNGKVTRVMHGIYRLVHFPLQAAEDLTMYWLWSNREGVFSHETALSLYLLSDALPARVHLTLPLSWQKRRLKVPRVLRLHYADIPEADRGWHGPVRVTTPARTVNDCALAPSQPQFVMQGIDQGLRRGLFSREEVAVAEASIAIFRGGR